MKKGMYLRPRMRRRANVFELGLAAVVGIVSGVYIFQDTLRHLPPPQPIETKDETKQILRTN